MAYYQCFKTKDRVTYCSSYEVKNHTEGAAWIGECMEANGIQASDLLGKPFEKDEIPNGATTWP